MTKRLAVRLDCFAIPMCESSQVHISNSILTYYRPLNQLIVFPLLPEILPSFSIQELHLVIIEAA